MTGLFHLGVYYMVHNVWEWTMDWYHSGFQVDLYRPFYIRKKLSRSENGINDLKCNIPDATDLLLDMRSQSASQPVKLAFAAFCELIVHSNFNRTFVGKLGEMDTWTDRKRRIIRFAAVAGTISLFVPTAAHAEKDSRESFWFRIDGYRPNVDSSVKIGNPATGQEGTLIDLEGDLSLRKRKTLPALAAGFSIGDSVQVNGEFYELARKGSIELDTEIDFDGVTYPVSANVDSQFTSKIYRLTVGYLVSKGDNHQLGVAAGAHVTEFAGSMAGEIAANGSGTQISTRRREVLAPLPTLGIYGSLEPVPRVILAGRADYLSLKIDDYKGRLLNLEVSAGYRISDKITMGVGYRRVDYRLNVDKPNWNGEVDYEFAGPSLFMRLGF